VLVFAVSLPLWLIGAVTGLQLLPGLPVGALMVYGPVTAASATRPASWLHCNHCCTGLTILLVIGVMELREMAVVAAAITVDRLAPAGERVARAIGPSSSGHGCSDRASSGARMTHKRRPPTRPPLTIPTSCLIRGARKGTDSGPGLPRADGVSVPV
jgi:Predicted metal-binding integral membrane protein (DUF2182)